MAVCGACYQEMTGKVGCTAALYEIGGVNYRRIPNNEQLPGCHDCGAPFGDLHHPGCDSEQCPICDGQSISCGCHGDAPEYAPDDGEAQRIAEVFADARAEQDRGL